MSEPRFRVQDGEMFVIHPDGDSEWRAVEMVYDAANAMVGVKLTADSPLRGTIVLLPLAALEAVRLSGRPVENLTL